MYLIDINLHFAPNNPQDSRYFVGDLHIGVEFGNEKRCVGVAHPVTTEFSNTENFIDIRPLKNGQREIQRDFRLYVSSCTFEEMEAARNGADALFYLKACGTVETPERSKQKGVEEIRLEIPRSNWIKLLEEAGYEKTIFFEIGMPDALALAPALKHMKDAQAAFGEGRYGDAVARCREVLDSVIENRGCPWKEATNDDLRRKMSVEDSFRLSWCTIRQITHTTHHRNKMKAEFTRPMAQYVLGTTCLALSLASKERDLFSKLNPEPCAAP